MPATDRRRTPWAAIIVGLAACAALAWVITLAVRGSSSGDRAPHVPAVTVRPHSGTVYATDPAPGASVELPAEDMHKAPIHFAGKLPVLLIALPGCSSCSLQEFEPDKIEPNRYTAVILLSSGGVFLNQLGKTRTGPKWRYIEDLNDVIARRLNANFVPRAYVLSPELKVEAVQPPNTNLNEFVKNLHP